MQPNATQSRTGFWAVLITLGAALALFVSWLTRFPWEW